MNMKALLNNKKPKGHQIGQSLLMRNNNQFK